MFNYISKTFVTWIWILFISKAVRTCWLSPSMWNHISTRSLIWIYLLVCKTLVIHFSFHFHPSFNTFSDETLSLESCLTFIISVYQYIYLFKNQSIYLSSLTPFSIPWDGPGHTRHEQTSFEIVRRWYLYIYRERETYTFIKTKTDDLHTDHSPASFISNTPDLFIYTRIGCPFACF